MSHQLAEPPRDPVGYGDEAASKPGAGDPMHDVGVEPQLRHRQLGEDQLDHQQGVFPWEAASADEHPAMRDLPSGRPKRPELVVEGCDEHICLEALPLLIHGATHAGQRRVARREATAAGGSNAVRMRGASGYALFARCGHARPV